MGRPDQPLTNGPPFDAVAFDCDSTLSSVEGIDELARRAGLGREMARLTADAMEGRVALEKIYGQRLDQIRPSRTAIRLLGELYVRRIVPGARTTIATLKGLGKKVYVVSGGIRQAVEHLAEHLGIPAEDVFAVDVHHDEHGQYEGFDTKNPLARSGGKVTVCQKIAKQDGTTVLVGDGMTDLEVMSKGIDFVAYGGAVERPTVKAEAPLYLAGPTMSPLLKHILTEDEQAEAQAAGF